METKASIDIRHRDRVATATPKGGTVFDIPAETMAEIQEAHRQDWVNLIEGGPREARTARRTPREVTTVVPLGVDATITCRVCGETLPFKKFPTTTSGGRETRCRGCRDAAKKESSGKVL